MEINQKERFPYLCDRCGLVYAVYDTAHYCSYCGSEILPLDPEAISGHKHVLVVDDSAPQRVKIGEICKSLGCVVTKAYDGVDGIEKAQSLDVDLIVLDVLMPRQNGLETLRQLRQDDRFLCLPIVMLTVKAETEIVAEAAASGATDYVLKDSMVVEIRQRLGKYLGTVGDSALLNLDFDID